MGGGLELRNEDRGMEKLLELLHSITEQKNEEITPSTELIMSGVLDSLNITSLITYLEEQTGTKIEVGELDLMTLSSPQDIVDNFLTAEVAE